MPGRTAVIRLMAVIYRNTRAINDVPGAETPVTGAAATRVKPARRSPPAPTPATLTAGSRRALRLRESQLIYAIGT